MTSLTYWVPTMERQEGDHERRLECLVCILATSLMLSTVPVTGTCYRGGEMLFMDSMMYTVSPLLSGLSRSPHQPQAFYFRSKQFSFSWGAIDNPPYAPIWPALLEHDCSPGRFVRPNSFPPSRQFSGILQNSLGFHEPGVNCEKKKQPACTWLTGESVMRIKVNVREI